MTRSPEGSSKLSYWLDMLENEDAAEDDEEDDDDEEEEDEDAICLCGWR